jgi:hypothetical protein
MHELKREKLGGRLKGAIVGLLALFASLAMPAAANALPATHFSVVAPPSATTGLAFSFTVTARDVTNAIDTGYSGTVHFTSTDGGATLPANSTLTNGVGTFSATLSTVGNQTLTATDTMFPLIMGTSGTIAVSLPRLAVSAPSSVTAGSPFNFTVTAVAANGGLDPAYSGTVHFTSTDGGATLPADSTLTNGVGTFSATLQTEGTRTITATDTGTPSITATSNGIAVSTASHFAVSAPTAVGVGAPFSFTVTALKPNGSVDSGYVGPVRFTSSDGSATLPGDSSLTSGSATFSATLRTPGSASITVVDSGNSSVRGTSGTIAVRSANSTSTRFRVRKLTRNHFKGTATLKVDVPGPGKLNLGGKGVGSQRVAVSGAGTVKLTIRARGGAKRKLRRTGAVTVTAKITFTPRAGAPQRKSKRVKLLLSR